jgi:N-acetylglucosaminyldiphosphoundecaprenol N-acetyl-beta-D-mannosaminyltransferase
MPENSVNLFGLSISNLTFEEALLAIRAYLEDNRKHYIFTPNTDHVVRLQRDPLFKKAYERASLVLPDGAPLLWASRLLKCPLKERVTGIDLFFSLCSLAAARGYRAYFLGARPDVLRRAMGRLSHQFDTLRIAGSHHGYFKSDDSPIGLINTARPDILFVGMGSPKQELWIHGNISKIDTRVALCVGGSFDILAGDKKRAPYLLQKVGMEWAWRMILEPRRLWRRYLIDDMKFLKLVLNERRTRLVREQKKLPL